jgi:molecular chaperone Hsp33
VDARGLAEEIRVRHGLEPDAARVAGEAVVAAVILSAYVKGEQRVELQIQGKRPRMAFTADVDAEGGARGRFTPAHLRQVRGERLDGLMMVTKSDQRAQLYRGVTAFEDKTMEEGLSAHLNGSEQVDVVVRLTCRADEEGSITIAGGVILERLPEDPNHPSMSREAFHERYSSLLEQHVEEVLTAFAFGSVVGEQVDLLGATRLFWRCSCCMERIEGVLRGLGAAELRAMLDEDSQAEVICHFCNIPYLVDAQRLSELIAHLESES